MIRGLYTSGWGMLALEKKMDTISNNMANASTTGFKKDTVVYQSFPDAMFQRINDTRSNLNPSGKVGNLQLGSDVGEVYTYFSQGQLTATGSGTDLAISGADSAFFTVSGTDADGNATEYYTRDGSFIVDKDGILKTSDGYTVVGKNGGVAVGSGEFSINEAGEVIKNGEIIDKLKMTQITNTDTLRKFGANLLQKTDTTEQEAFSGSIRQGYLEQSNVSIIKEMVNMITVTRSYEANQKMIQAMDTTLDMAVNQVGRV
ncbi:MAG: flagellar hook-basal body protein [Clostridiales bacterium]|nr:flagellar hook-basal body protein [Clostridiales bacterium]